VVFSYLPYFGGYGGFGGFGGYGFPYSGYPLYGAPYSYLPNYWWVSPYPIADPRQEGYNPSAGYEWDSVGTMILTTSPPQTRVTLDGVFVGTSDKLGPFQLPAGEHTLHLAANGYESSDTIVKIERSGPVIVDIMLKHLRPGTEPVPQP
jgi:hypothetical protein